MTERTEPLTERPPLIDELRDAFEWSRQHGYDRPMFALSRAIQALDAARAPSTRSDAEAAVKDAFRRVRRGYITHPAEGGDGTDAVIGDALNDAEKAVLAVLHAADTSTRDPGEYYASPE